MLLTIFIFCLVLAVLLLFASLLELGDEAFSAVARVGLIGVARTCIITAAVIAAFETLIKIGVIARFW